MPGDDDIARLLPEPPPPRAARREAAIGAAMRRFDGEAPAPVATPARAPVWARLRQPQVAAFASVALVAVIGIPLALTTLERERHPPSAQPVPVAVASKETHVAPSVGTPGAGNVVNQVPAKAYNRIPTRHGDQDSATIPPPVIVLEPVQDCGKGDCEDGVVHAPVNRFAALKPVRSAPPPAAVASADQIAGYDARGIARAAPAPEPPSAKMADASAEPSIMVTGSRIRQPALAPRRGDWNACTLNDPDQSLAGCGALIDPGANGQAGEAAARVSDGLSRAWKGDFSAAINDFSAAIAIQPRLAIAYLNRGLAYQRLGESRRALADLNAAIRYAPSAARGYYNRSLILDQAGDTERAKADAERAAQIDPRYRAAIE